MARPMCVSMYLCVRSCMHACVYVCMARYVYMVIHTYTYIPLRRWFLVTAMQDNAHTYAYTHTCIGACSVIAIRATTRFEKYKLASGIRQKSSQKFPQTEQISRLYIYIHAHINIHIHVYIHLLITCIFVYT
jgi:hypothetical protein